MDSQQPNDVQKPQSNIKVTDGIGEDSVDEFA